MTVFFILYFRQKAHLQKHEKACKCNPNVEKNPIEEISEYEKIQQENIAKRKAQMAKLFPELANKQNKKSVLKPKSKQSPACKSDSEDLRKISKRISKFSQNLKENIDPKIKKRSVSSDEINNSEHILNPDKIYPKPKRICKDLRICIPRVKIPEPYVVDMPSRTLNPPKRIAKIS